VTWGLQQEQDTRIVHPNRSLYPIYVVNQPQRSPLRRLRHRLVATSREQTRFAGPVLPSCLLRLIPFPRPPRRLPPANFGRGWAHPQSLAFDQALSAPAGQARARLGRSFDKRVISCYFHLA